MKLPTIINNCLPLLRALTSYNVEDVALVNSLNAKLAYMVSLKGIKFKQFNNAVSKPISYYAINFMPSGSSKDFTIDCINNYLLNFLSEYLENKLESYKERYYEEQYQKRVAVASPKSRDRAEQLLNEEMDQFRVINVEIEEANLTGVYEEAKQIDMVGVGAIFIRIPELGDYIDAANKNSKDKRDLMAKMKNIYEGTITPSIIGGNKKRKPIKDIPVQALMYTDFESLLDGSNNKYLKEMLKTGYARRCFIYTPKDEDYKLNYPVAFETVNECLLQTKQLRDQLYNIFNKLTSKDILFSEEAQQLIYDYKCKCIDKVNKMRRKKSIVATDLSESFWKIQKLSVLYAVLDDPTTMLVDSIHFQMAVDFYNTISPSLKYIIDKREATSIERAAAYMVENNIDGVVSKLELRKQRFVSEREFSVWIERNFEDLKEELSEYGYTLLEYNHQKNGYQICAIEGDEKDVLTDL